MEKDEILSRIENLSRLMRHEDYIQERAEQTKNFSQIKSSKEFSESMLEEIKKLRKLL
ncbi:hypothetical protein RU86_GL000553 [Lactococcus piscium]|uniref:Uncharacterized protein n=1 Tax=Pseudolactococcus piscium TaxID=1364 RepID=A0A2A5RXA3_9LACT|nr:hypothetical protein [Lactococcus piscium]PCS05798.1 hypothetical protein RU86_GL000553 [Lactococcus piscium]